MTALPAQRRSGTVVAHRRPFWLGEGALVAVFYAAYAWVRDAHGRATAGDVAERVATTHGTAVLHLEQRLHLDPEHGLQSALLPSGGLPLHVLNAVYLLAHLSVTVTVLVFLFVRRPAIYRRCRNVLLAVSAAALALFSLFPTVPPRLLLAAHVRDGLASGGLWSLDHGAIERVADPYAAMPSLHLGWSTWVALSLAAAFPMGARRWLFALYPAAVAVLVLTNGAHWLLDVAAGAALTGTCWTLIGRHASRREA